MPVLRVKAADEPMVIEGNRSRISVSGMYVAFGIDGVPLVDRVTGEPLGREGRSVAPLAEDEWSSSMRLMPEWVETVIRGHGEPDLHYRIELRDGSPQLVELGWRSDQKQAEIRQKHLRSLDVSDFVAIAYRRWIYEIHDAEPDREGASSVLEMLPDSDQDRVARDLLADLDDLRYGRRQVNSELLRQVAEVYREHFDHAPVEAVARKFGVKKRMAHEYVSRARQHGFLPPTTQGKKAK